MKRILFICAIIAVAITACNKVEDTESPTQEAKNNPETWEYLVMKVTDRDIANQTIKLNQLSSEGWELVTTHSQIGTHISRNNSYYEHVNVQTTALYYVLKRPRGNYPITE